MVWCSGLTSGESQRGGGEEQSFGVLSAQAMFKAAHLAYCHSPTAIFEMYITEFTVAIISSLSHIRSPMQTTTP